MISQMTPAGNSPAIRGQVDRRFGLARAHQHAAVARAQRKDVAGPCEVAGPRFGIDRREDRLRAIVGRDAGRHTASRFDRNAERRAVRRSVRADRTPSAEC